MHRLLVPILSIATLSSCSLAAHTKPDRDSGQSNLMDESFAGKNKCNPDNHLRPFIIEWDATDSSSFQEFADENIVFVHYEGCSLRVLDECRNQSVKGELGSYKPTTWTEGALETLDVKNEAELYAKLPLGQATLGARVQGGEKFHMEYYVAGTRAATRDAVYRGDLTDRKGCEDATHFVYGYNVGAFALASAKNLTASAGGSFFGFGAGASENRQSDAEKHGGQLAVCDSESAAEIKGCKAPIRLTLRDIREGENPDKAAMKRTDTPESLAAAGLIDAKMKTNEKANAAFESAMRKLGANDGKGCLAELDSHDKADPKHKSTDPVTGYAFTRSQCLMLAGQCDAGKSLVRRWAEQASSMKDADGAQIDSMVEMSARTYCQGKMSDRDALLKAISTMQTGSNNTNVGIRGCSDAMATIMKLRKKVKPRDGEDYDILNLDRNLPALAAGCFGRNGDCKLAMKWMKQTMSKEEVARWDADPERDKLYANLLGDFSPKCKKV
jgi:hypothetical protein